MTLDHRRCQVLIARCFEQGRLPPSDDAAMRAHLRECPTCERVYERFAAAEAALYRGPSDRAVGPGQVDRVAERLFDEASSSANGGPRRSSRAIGGALAAAAAAAVLLVVASLGDDPAGDGLRSRQGSPAAVAPDVGLRALRVRPSGADRDFQVMDLGTAGTVRPGDQVALLYTNLGDLDRVVIERVTPEGTETTVVEVTEIRSGVEDQRLATLAVGRDWAAGSHLLRARFTGPAGRTELRKVRVEVESP